MRESPISATSYHLRTTFCCFRSINLVDAHACGRGDDSRALFFPDLCPPVPHSQIGPAAALMFTILLRGGKATQVHTCLTLRVAGSQLVQCPVPCPVCQR